jgi:hypothetical protein
VDADKLPPVFSLDEAFEGSFCVHMMVHTHETYTFARNDGKSESAKTKHSTNPHSQRAFSFARDPSESSIQNLKAEMNLAAIEDRHNDLFAYNPAKYKIAYPDGNALSENFGITWQLVDIDFLVSRSQGWIEMAEQGDIDVIDRFCYQPPVDHLECTEDHGNNVEVHESTLENPMLIALVWHTLSDPLFALLVAYLFCEQWWLERRRCSDIGTVPASKAESSNRGQ